MALINFTKIIQQGNSMQLTSNHFGLALIIIFIISPLALQGVKKGYINHSTKSYAKKTPYSGFGKKSKVNGLPKIKPISGHGKRTRTGYTYVNPYSRST